MVKFKVGESLEITTKDDLIYIVRITREYKSKRHNYLFVEGSDEMDTEYQAVICLNKKWLLGIEKDLPNKAIKKIRKYKV